MIDHDALDRAIINAVRFADWAAGQGICAIVGDVEFDPSDFLYDAMSEQGVEDIEPLIDKVRERLRSAAPSNSDHGEGGDGRG